MTLGSSEIAPNTHRNEKINFEKCAKVSVSRLSVRPSVCNNCSTCYNFTRSYITLLQRILDIGSMAQLVAVRAFGRNPKVLGSIPPRLVFFFFLFFTTSYNNVVSWRDGAIESADWCKEGGSGNGGLRPPREPPRLALSEPADAQIDRRWQFAMTSGSGPISTAPHRRSPTLPGR